PTRCPLRVFQIDRLPAPTVTKRLPWPTYATPVGRYGIDTRLVRPPLVMAENQTLPPSQQSLVTQFVAAASVRLSGLNDPALASPMLNRIWRRRPLAVSKTATAPVRRFVAATSLSSGLKTMVPKSAEVRLLHAPACTRPMCLGWSGSSTRH